MGKGRLEAFSDAVIAIIMTIMVLEFKAPHEVTWASLCALAPTFFCYVLSFIFLGIYWNNHHHMIHAARNVTGGVLWANQHLMFWLSLIPFVTAWMGENRLSTVTVATYGIVLFFCGVAYYILSLTLVQANGKDSTVAHALGKDRKGKISIVTYAVAIAAAFLAPIVSCCLYVLVAFIWLVPDRRFERLLNHHA